MADDQGQGPDNDHGEHEDLDRDESTDQDGAEGETEDSNEQDDDSSKESVSRAELEKVLARMKAADRRATAAEHKLREKEQAEMSELDRTKVMLEEAQKARDEADARYKSMVIENAFHRENKYSWHDVADAIAALDLSGVEVGEDGKVTGMAEAIKQVAKKKPHYVRSKEEGDGATPPAANGATNGKRKGEGEAPDRKTLVARFPALGK